MSQDIWINLPVKNVEKSTAFFNEIGFHAVSVGSERAKLTIGQTTILLFPDAAFEKFTGSTIAQKSYSQLVLIAEKKLMLLFRKLKLPEEVSLANQVKMKAGCTAQDLQTWMVIGGTCCTWMRAKCRNAN